MDIDTLINSDDDKWSKGDWVDGDFKNLGKFAFCGVYVIYDDKKNNEIVYVGSAYARTVGERLKQYISEKDTGNTLMHAIFLKANKEKGVKDIEEKESSRIIAKIKGYKIKAIEHDDLEYKLIRKANPKYNKAGKKKSQSTRGKQNKSGK